MRRTLLGMLAIVSMTLFVTIHPASASTIPSSKSMSSTLSRAGVNHVRSAATASIITCTAQINNPHHSVHVSTTVNVTASVTCTAPVSALSMTITLSWDGYFINSCGPKSNAGSATISMNCAVPCQTGSWQGVAYGGIVFPPGYVPPTNTYQVAKTASVTSCA